MNIKDQLGKFLAKADENILVRYSSSIKTYKVYNKIIYLIEESLNMFFEKKIYHQTQHKQMMEICYLNLRN